ncbi:MAG TPA: ring-cleaving dioxygenase [Ktedonobacterales bacterium]|nr:ring-cleaving dioxygenase [Ktedonobacterales bacterium]
MELTGLHHVSALTAQAANNVDFYTRVLGLRLVKKTVNQDDVSSYHLFYGDEHGNPGTEVTFFDIPYAAPLSVGSRSISRIALRVAGAETLAWWRDRFDELGVAHDAIATEAGRGVLAFRDPEGQRLALVDDTGAPLPGGTPWARSATPAPMGIRGLGGVTLTVPTIEPTALVLTEVMGFRQQGTYAASEGPERDIVIFGTGVGGPGAEVHVDPRPDLPRERLGRGGVHHVAYRVPTAEQHLEWLDRLETLGMRTSGLVDRYYFKSIYFREPSGILFELATDGPGFLTDEDEERLGERLSLPPFLEPRRAAIEAGLHSLDTAAATQR